MAVLSTVEDFVREARVLLQDLLEPYRYSNDELIQALNMGLEQAHKLRRDLFLRYETTPYYPTLSATAVDIDPGYRRPILFFMVGHAQLRDEEETTDSRASAFLNAFAAQMSAPGA